MVGYCKAAGSYLIIPSLGSCLDGWTSIRFLFRLGRQKAVIFFLWAVTTILQQVSKALCAMGLPQA